MDFSKESRKGVIMVGPDPNGLGGISRVVRTWKEDNLYEIFNIRYIQSVSDPSANKLRDLQRAVVSFLKALWNHRGCVYIHTASNNSFYRKTIFILISIGLKKKLILHIHPSYFIVFLANFKGFKKMFFCFLLNRVDTFVVLTEGIKRDLQAMFPGKNIHVVGNPVSLERMANRHAITRRNNRLLYLGWYLRRKGVYELVDAVRILVDRGCKIQMDFYGTKEISKLREYVESTGLKHVICVNGWADDKDKLNALYSSTLLILPSHTEGVPMVVLEAMATKTPIVSTLVGGLKEILRDGENAVIAEPENAEDLSRKILALLEDPVFAEQIAENAYREVARKFDSPVIKARLKAILDHVCN